MSSTTDPGGNLIGAFEFSAALWVHAGTDPWHFITLPAEVGEEIAELTEGLRGGFGSVRVAVTVGGTSWRTSVFPDKTSGSYVLPMKKAVRAAEGLTAGDEVTITLELADL